MYLYEILLIYKIMKKIYCNVYKCELYRMGSLTWWLHNHPFGHKVLHGIFLFVSLFKQYNQLFISVLNLHLSNINYTM